MQHFDTVAPARASEVPDLLLYDLEGQPVRLRGLLDGRPAVIRVGSHSCPVYRYRRFSMTDLRRDYADRVNFIVVYVIEAHPAGTPSPYADEEWLSPINWLTNVRIPQPQTLEERIAQAESSVRSLALEESVYVDPMENRFWREFGRAPSAGFVLDARGRVALRQVWADPQAMREILDALLANRGLLPPGPHEAASR